MDNNIAVRNMLKQRGVKPEALPASEDVVKLKKKLESDEQQILREAKKTGKQNKDGK